MSFGLRVTIPAGLTPVQIADVVGNTSIEGYTGAAALKLAAMVALAKRIVPHVIEAGAVGNSATDEFVVDINGHVCEDDSFDYFGNNLGINISQKRPEPVSPPEPVNGRGWAAQQAATGIAAGQQYAANGAGAPAADQAAIAPPADQVAPPSEDSSETAAPAGDDVEPGAETEGEASTEAEGAEAPPDAGAEIAAAASSDAPA